MGKIANLLSNSGIASVKGMMQAANVALQSISLTDIGKACDEGMERLGNEFKRFKEQIKTFTDKHTVEIPFNTQTHHMSYEIRENTLSVNVKSNDDSQVSQHVITVPDDIDLTNMSQSYDSERKTMIFKFGKKLSK